MTKPIARSLDFTHTHPQRNFKLLELPPELVELVTAKGVGDGDGDGGQGVRLSLKSSPAPPSPSTSTSASATSTQSAYVNLCTPTQTYMIRNVHSSNSIYLITPSLRTTSSAEDTAAAQAGIGVLDRNDCVTAVAQCHATLELVKIDGAGGGNVVGCLKGLGRVFGGAQVEEEGADVRMGGGDGDGVTEKERGRAVKRIFADVPFSTRECEVGWVEVCGFVYPGENGGGKLVGWWPSADVRLEVWRRMVEGAVLQGIELGRQFLVGDLWRAVGDDDGEGNVPFPRELVEAVVRRVMGDSGSVFEELKWASIDKQVAVSWVGETYLEATAPDPTLAISRDKFLDSWKDLLPEGWRDEATWDNLKNGCFQYPQPTTVCFKPRTENKNTRPVIKKRM